MPLFALLFFLFCSCASQRVLSIPAAEAEKMLHAGDIQFILDARLQKMGQIARIATAAPFYAALLVDDYHKKNKDNVEAGKKAIALLNNALADPVTRTPAANRLIPLDPDYYFNDSKKKTPASLASSAPDSDWAAAFALLREADTSGADSETFARSTRDYFFGRRWTHAGYAGVATSAVSAGNSAATAAATAAATTAAEWAFDKMRGLAILPLTEKESAACAARFAVAKRDYGPAYRQFRASIQPEEPAEGDGEKKATLAAPLALLAAYPELLNDLGRAFQYGGGINEGIKLFPAYDSALETAIQNGELDSETGEAARYLLQHYLGRFYRATKNYAKAAAFFTSALARAPDAAQKDACIWYIIDVNYAQKPENALAQIRAYAARWNDPSYFDDILDKYAYHSSSTRKWRNMLDIYPVVVSHASPALRAKYAYVIARALEEGYLTTKMEGITPNKLLNIAYNQQSDYYYRAMAGKRLSKDPAITGLPDEAPDAAEAAAGSNMAFLLDFFRFGCARFAGAYISDRYDTLTIPELRLLAKNLTEAGRYGDAIRLVVKYSKRDDFTLSRADMELSYPRAFRDLVERYAQKAKIEENYLYALMRTESIFIPDIVSRAGALGLTQLMPATGRQMAEFLAQNGGPNYIEDDTINLLDPELNIHLGALYYKDMENRMGSAQSALMAYNGGIGRVRRWKRSSKNMPDDLFAETIEITETREYSKKVIGGAAIYQFLYN
ncbi:MAG: lytic transglycosylase domain-containing protein [Spirochaetaceae bacterium]|jgi:soluble lytic murein transglycosylase|nr:lytic transglycosylase domain-containing protein [Spirochaetaceae bacterium]